MLLWIIAGALAGSVLFFQLGGLVADFAPQELAVRESSSSLQRIIDNPVNAPHKLGQLVLQTVGFNGPMAMRSVSALYGLLVIFLFFSVLRHWFTMRMAILGTVLFAVSSWFLHVARLGTPDILQAGILALVACGLWLRFSKQRSWAILIASLVAIVCLYIPGMVWFVIALAIWQGPIILKELKRMPALPIILTGLASLVLLAPLIIASFRRPMLLANLAGLPEQFIGWQAIGKNFISIPVQLFARGPDNPVLWLGRLPILDVFSIAMFVLGTYYLYFRRRLDRTKLLLGILVVGSLLTALGGLVSLTILLPFVYIIITVGLSLMLQQWFTVFPRNPLARSLGVVLLSAALLVTVYYHTTRYFIAWPNNPQTQQAFNQNS